MLRIPQTWKLNHALRQGIGWTLLAIGGMAGLVVLIMLGRTILSLPKEIAAPVITGVVTVFVAVGSLVWSRHSQMEGERHKVQLSRKTEIYEQLVDDLMSVLNVTKRPASREEQEKRAALAMESFTTKALVWASPRVITAWTSFKTTATTNAGNNDQSQHTLRSLEALLFALREDLGLSAKGLDSDDLLRLFITDIGDFKKAST